MNEKNLEELTQIFKALGNKARLTVLLTLSNGEEVSGLHHNLDMSRSGLQKNIETLIDANLVYRPEDSTKTYELTALGEKIVYRFDEIQDLYESIIQQFDEELEKQRMNKQEILQQMEEAGLDTSSVEQSIESKAWSSIDDSVSKTEADGSDVDE